MIKFLLLLLFLLIPFHPAVAQHEADNWYFGANAGLSFKSGAPTILSDGTLNAQEGSAVMSDKLTGALMFYTDGDTVWNSRHEVMTGGIGLNGGKSSTQSAFIVPNPGNSLEYYIFTTPDLSGVFNPTITGFYYSIVSMDVPLGRVTTKNILLIDSIAEKVSGTLDCTQTGYWVVTHHRRKSEFYSFHITPSGITTTPVISSYQSDIDDFTIGTLKVSPDGAKIAMASIPNKAFSKSKSGLMLYTFDSRTGRVLKPIALHSVGPANAFYYSACFSPDNTKLYAAAGSGRLMQFTVGIMDSGVIHSSVYIFQSANVVCEGMQLGPDGKIYLAQVYPSYSRYISVIDKPNESGIACDYRENAVMIAGTCGEGFPNFMDHIFSTIHRGYICPLAKAIVNADSACLGTAMVFVDRSIGEPTRRIWTFENGSPATSTDSIVTVHFSKPGTHRVRLLVWNESARDTTDVDAVVFPVPTAQAGIDTTICSGETVMIGGQPEPNTTYRWQPAIGLSSSTSANPNATPPVTTEYILTAINQYGCMQSDTVKVFVNSTGNHEFTLQPMDSVLLPGRQLQVALTVPAGNQSWSMLIGYNERVLHFNSIIQATNGIIATAALGKNQQVAINGTGDSGVVILLFDAFLPPDYDTVFSITLEQDSARFVQPCGSITTTGCTMPLGGICARLLRIIQPSDKRYYLISRENGIDCGIGLDGNVRMELYDYTGTRQAILVDGILKAGEYYIEPHVPAGIYFCRMSSGRVELMTSMLVMP